MQSACFHLYLTWCYQSCLWDDSSHCRTYTFPTSPSFRSKPVYVCLCCGMKGSIVWKRCVWNPCCLVGVRGRYVRKRTPFYSWHGSVWNATLGRAAPLSSLCRSSTQVPYFSRTLSLSICPSLFHSLEIRGYWPRQLGLWASLVPFSCLVWDNKSEDAPFRCFFSLNYIYLLESKVLWRTCKINGIFTFHKKKWRKVLTFFLNLLQTKNKMFF